MVDELTTSSLDMSATNFHLFEKIFDIDAMRERAARDSSVTTGMRCNDKSPRETRDRSKVTIDIKETSLVDLIVGKMMSNNVVSGEI